MAGRRGRSLFEWVLEGDGADSLGRAEMDSDEVDVIVELAVDVPIIVGDTSDWFMAEEEGRVPSGPAPVCRDSGAGVVWEVVCGVAVADAST
jgi:hypothetical protein